MPVYDFKCDKCEKVTERLTKSDVHAITCDCGGLMGRQISMPMVVLDGCDPSLPGAYDKWARDREKRFKQNQRKNG